MSVDVVVGLQWGDEGKGKIVDVLAEQYDIVARYQGGPNAGHTLYVGKKKYVLHSIPSAIFHSGKISLIGHGVVLDPVTLCNEIIQLESLGFNPKQQLLISDKAHLILPSHKLLDAAFEVAKKNNKVGSTLRGVGPSYGDKIARNGIRVGDLFSADWKEKYQQIADYHRTLCHAMKYEPKCVAPQQESEFFAAVEALKKCRIINTVNYLHQALASGKQILAEGAQGTMLDIDFGTYPFVTSSTTTSSGVCSGLGVAFSDIKKVYGVTKSYATRVGAGPFPTEIHSAVGQQLAARGKEKGATTGRSRRCGWLDLVALQYAVRLNGVTDLVVTKSDVLSGLDKIKIAVDHKKNSDNHQNVYQCLNINEITTQYLEFACWNEPISAVKTANKLPQTLLNYLHYIADKLNVPIFMVSVGAHRRETIFF